MDNCIYTKSNFACLQEQNCDAVNRYKIPPLVPRFNTCYIPDDEVDCKVEYRGIVYSYSAGIPFGDLTVGEYYRYQTALRGEVLEVRGALRSVGLRVRLRKKMRRLSVRQYRRLQIAVRVRNTTTERKIKTKSVNLRKLNKILAARGLEFVGIPKLS